MDFMIQLPKWNGMDAILIIVDQFFKLTKMVTTKMITTTFNLGNCFLICGLSTMRCLNSLQGKRHQVYGKPLKTFALQNGVQIVF